MNDPNVEEILKTLASDEIPTDVGEIAERVSGDFARHVAKTRPSTHLIVWETIMKRKITKLAAGVVIVAGILLGAFRLGDSVESVAWGRLVSTMQGAHDDSVAQLLLAVEARDAAKVEYCADLLDEFWQNLNWLAKAHCDPKAQSQLIAESQARIADRPADNDEKGIGMFLAHAEEFIGWLGAIEDEVWIDETTHVCKQLEEYLEEIRDGARSAELGWPYIEHCLPSFVAHCDWFEQLPWEDPGREMTSAVLLAGIGRDLEAAAREIRNPTIRGGHRWAKRSLQQAQRNAGTLARRADDDARIRLCRSLAGNLDSAIDLVTYLGIAVWDVQETRGVEHTEACRVVLERDLGGQGPLKDRLMRQIDKLSQLCESLSAGRESP